MRIHFDYAYIYFMKTRLNITIEDSLLTNIKAYANKQQTSVSELVEHYFKNITRPARINSILTLVEKLQPPEIDTTADLKDLFYKEQAKKYGF